VGPAALDPVDRVDLVDLVVLDPAARDRADRVDPADLGLADLVVLDPVVPHPAGPAALAPTRGQVDRADPVGLADLDLAGLADLDLAGRADLDLAGRAGLVVLDLAGRVGLADQGMDPVDRVDLAGRAERDLAERDLAGREDLADQGMNPVDPVGRAGPDLTVRVDPVDLVDLVDLVDRADRAGLAGLVIRADRHRRRTRPEVLSTGVGPRWADPGMCRTASAPPTTVHRPRPHNTDGVGMAGLHPERRRLSGTDPRPRAAGTVHRLRVVGTAHGTVQRATWQSRSVISDRSITTGTTRSRCSTRFSGDGASGSSDSGFRCTETT
jgi:hypothetical protein